MGTGTPVRYTSTASCWSATVFLSACKCSTEATTPVSKRRSSCHRSKMLRTALPSASWQQILRVEISASVKRGSPYSANVCRRNAPHHENHHLPHRLLLFHR